ncbi:hypothetical protein BC829DRAFT_384983 [Chytridium lagenaria]|nr:hypothetical protein BC829DRAFT_384983 [Chytridium lagenaria]
MTEESSHATTFNFCTTGFLLLECAYIQPGFKTCLNIMLLWSTISVILGFFTLESRPAAKLGNAMEWALLCFLFLVYLEFGMTGFGHFPVRCRLMTSLRNVFITFAILLYVDMILSMNFYVTESLAVTLLRFSVKPLYVLCVVGEGITTAYGYMVDVYKTSPRDDFKDYLSALQLAGVAGVGLLLAILLVILVFAKKRMTGALRELPVDVRVGTMKDLLDTTGMSRQTPLQVTHMAECLRAAIGFLNVLIWGTALSLGTILGVVLMVTFIKSVGVPLIPVACCCGFLVLLIHNWRRLVYTAVRRRHTVHVQVREQFNAATC